MKVNYGGTIEILKKQREVDQYVFEQHRDEIAQKGFVVTHTGPQGSYVEIGIEPYSENNAEYLYKLFGKDKVKVVQGQQAYTLELPAAGNGEAGEVRVAVDIASANNSENEAVNTSMLLMFAYALSAVTILVVAVVTLKRMFSYREK